MKDKELPITSFEPKGNQFGLRDLPGNQGSRLLIGGPCDGDRHTPSDPRDFKKIVLPVPGPPLTFKEWEKLDPEAQPPIVAVYWPEILRGNEIEMIFYRHESLSVDQALVFLLARYPNIPAQ